MAIKLKIGSPVVGEDFFGREVELRKAEALIRDNNLMLAAPRRVGKTSFARKMLRLSAIFLIKLDGTSHSLYNFYYQDFLQEKLQRQILMKHIAIFCRQARLTPGMNV
jgi:ATP-dependent protease HslVU (ClpYQ) ATPase subunit